MPTLFYPIRLPSDVLEALGEFTGHFWSDTLALEPFVIEAIRNYLHPAPAAEAPPAATHGTGYQWKQVYLPDGTRLRASFGGHSYVARVEGDEIKYGAYAMSPSRFANLQGSGNRTAWKAIWLCLPGSDEWVLADVLRSARQAAVARLLGEGAPAAAQASAQVQPQPEPRDDSRSPAAAGLMDRIPEHLVIRRAVVIRPVQRRAIAISLHELGRPVGHVEPGAGLEAVLRRSRIR